MELKDEFEVTHTRDGVAFKLKRISSTLFNVSWDESDYPAGNVDMSQDTIERNLTRGVWKVKGVGEVLDSFTVRLAFFQQHIDALTENLESLVKAFEELKRQA